MNPDSRALLLVDDDIDVCANMADILADLGGYHVDVAHDGPPALQLVRQRPYDVALLDLRKPGMDGLTLYRELKKLRAGTVAILVTAFASELATGEADRLGVWQIVKNPVYFPQLMGLVEEVLGQPLVLVVDDDRDLCETLWDLLREHGYRVCLAHDVGQAEERLQTSSYRVVVVDLKLPQGDGREVLRRVRSSHPEVRTVLVTGYPEELEPQVEGVTAVYRPGLIGHWIQCIHWATETLRSDGVTVTHAIIPGGPRQGLPGVRRGKPLTSPSRVPLQHRTPSAHRTNGSSGKTGS
jgi:DNA-binding NtrC family response regulator